MLKPSSSIIKMTQCSHSIKSRKKKKVYCTQKEYFSRAVEWKGGRKICDSEVIWGT